MYEKIQTIGIRKCSQYCGRMITNLVAKVKFFSVDELGENTRIFNRPVAFTRQFKNKWAIVVIEMLGM